MKKFKCPACGGDGRETCDNPDHGNYRCPVCGYDPDHKVLNGGECGLCEGAGYVEESAAVEFCNEMEWDIDLEEWKN